MKNHEKNGMASVIAALVANILVAISKFIAFFVSGSTAMMNEAIHSIVDCGNQLLLLVGDKKSKRLASTTHPFGESRAKYFYSTIVAMMLFFGGGALGIMEAVKKLGEPHHSVENPTVVLTVLLFGIIVEAFSLRVALKEIKVLNKDKLPLFKFLKESRHGEVIIIFAEDSCAVLGLLIAVIGTLLTMLTDNSIYDALSGLLIGIMLCVAAILLAREFYGLLMGESVSESDLKIIKSAFSNSNIDHIIDIKTIHLSAIDIIITAKISLIENHTMKSSELVNHIERNIREQLSDKKCYVYIEIDDFDSNYQN